MEPRVEGVEQMISSIFRSSANRVTGNPRGLALWTVICAVISVLLLQFGVDLHASNRT